MLIHKEDYRSLAKFQNEMKVSFHFQILYGGIPLSKDTGFQQPLHLKDNTNNDKKVKNLYKGINKITTCDMRII